MSKPPRRAMTTGDDVSLKLKPDQVRLGDQFALSKNGLIVAGNPPMKAWEPIAGRLLASEKGSTFAIGDYANELEDRFGEEAAQILDPSTGWSLKTLDNYRWVARNVPQRIRRMDRLTMRHHQLVAKSSLTEKQRERWLTRAANDDGDEPWTVQHMRDAMKKSGELEEVFWIIVKCPNGQVQSDLVDRLTTEGLLCEAKQAKRAKKRPPKKSDEKEAA